MGRPVAEARRSAHWSFDDTLEVSIGIAQALQELHRHHLAHLDLNAAHVLVGASPRDVWLIDFAAAGRLDPQTGLISRPVVPASSLAHQSPEQSGRTRRLVDRRADLYALGVMMYEMLAGRLPFEGRDASELIHGHLAAVPKSVAEVAPRVPGIISRVVERLMAKSPDERYQSAKGVAADLVRCRDELRASGRVLDFALGRDDASEYLRLPQRLYGRGAERETLFRAYERAAASGKELVLLAGRTGTGKTTLVRELEKSPARGRGLFIEGKFDFSQTSLPYSAWIQAFSDLMHRLLSESEAEVASWARRISSALGGDGRMLTDVMPALELVIGPQPGRARRVTARGAESVRKPVSSVRPGLRRARAAADRFPR